MKTAHNAGPLYDYQGERLNLRQIAIRTGLPSATLGARMKRGMTLEQAIEAPDQRTRQARRIKEAA